MKTQKDRMETTEKTGTKPVDLLKEDHQKVKALFREFEKAAKPQRKESIVGEVIHELKVHTKVEEELFYPAARQELETEEGQELMNEAHEEHHVVDLLIAELEAMGAEDAHYDAKFIVLSENVKHHIEEEEGDLFLKIKKTEANSPELGERMRERKAELQNQIKNQAAPRKKAFAA